VGAKKLEHMRAAMTITSKDNPRRSQMKDVKKTVSSSKKAKQYHGFCSKCNNSWDSSTVPTECPRCGNKGITYTEKE